MNTVQQTKKPSRFLSFGLLSLIVMSVLLFFVTSCSTPSTQADGQATRDTQNLWVPQGPLPDQPPFPLYSLSPQGGPNQVLAFVSGTVVDVAEDFWGGFRVVLEVPNNYFWNGQRIETTYQLVIGNLLSADTGLGPVEQGALLGVAQEVSYISARSPGLDRNMLRETQTFPEFFAGGWWFQPSWLLPEHLGYLSFRQVENPGPSAREFIQRLEPIREPGESFSLSFDDPGLQSIRFPLVLDELPGPANRTDALDQTEMLLFGQTGVFGLSTTLENTDANVELFWLMGYDQYLAQEIGIGEVVWVYAYMYTVDWENDQVIILARDFAPFSDEEVIDFRLNELAEAFPDMELRLPPLP